MTKPTYEELAWALKYLLVQATVNVTFGTSLPPTVYRADFSSGWELYVDENRVIGVREKPTRDDIIA